MIPPLYKYCKFNDENYDYKNLENDTLYFSSPSSYNDPYEGVIANNIVDIFEALFIAQIMHSSTDPDPILEKLKHAFLLPRIILNISNLQNTPEIKNYIRTVINKILENAKYDDVQLVAIELLHCNDYVQHFKYISSASLPIDLYFTVLKKALNENSRLSSNEKEYYFPILLNNYKEKHSLVNKYRKTTNLIIPIFLVDAIFNTPFRRRMMLPYHSSLIMLSIIRFLVIAFTFSLYKLSEPHKKIFAFGASILFKLFKCSFKVFLINAREQFLEYLVIHLFFLLSSRNGDHIAESSRQYSHRSFRFFCCDLRLFEFCFTHDVTSFVWVTPTISQNFEKVQTIF